MPFYITPGVDITIIENSQILVRTPTGDFVIVDKTSIISKVLYNIENCLPFDDAFEEIHELQRAATSERVLNMLLQRRVISPSLSQNPADVDPIRTWLAFVEPDLELKGSCTLAGRGMVRDSVEAALSSVGIQCDDIETSSPSSLIIGCFDALSTSERLALNRRALDANIPLLVAGMDRSIVTIGPLIIPRATACYECYVHRTRVNEREYSALQAASYRAKPSQFVATFAGLHVSLETLRFLSGAVYDLHVATVKRYDLVSGRNADTVVLKLPRCPACGGGNLDRPLKPTFAPYTQDIVR